MTIDLGPTPAQLRCDAKTHLGNTPRQDGDGYLCRGRTGKKLTGKDSYRQYRGRCCATGLESRNTHCNDILTWNCSRLSRSDLQSACLSLFRASLDFGIIPWLSTALGGASMERVEADKLSKRTSTKVWNVQAFCRRQNLCQKEEWRLTRLFGRFATASELLHNAKRAPRWRY